MSILDTCYASGPCLTQFWPSSLSAPQFTCLLLFLSTFLPPYPTLSPFTRLFQCLCSFSFPEEFESLAFSFPSFSLPWSRSAYLAPCSFSCLRPFFIYYCIRSSFHFRLSVRLPAGLHLHLEIMLRITSIPLLSHRIFPNAFPSFLFVASTLFITVFFLCPYTYVYVSPFSSLPLPLWLRLHLFPPTLCYHGPTPASFLCFWAPLFYPRLLACPVPFPCYPPSLVQPFPHAIFEHSPNVRVRSHA